ncbi:O-antigen ligase family protein [Candidatus Roizmanbacteria bacterium]|nr:O-antigen ligase family protein [Candidatus Roizmanbacteria bacterium]
MMPILSVFILTPLIIEGLGVFSQRTYLGYYYLILPLCLFIFSLIKKKPIRFPTIASIFFILFLIFSLISSLNFSVDKQISFEWWLFYLANFLVFIFFYNFKSEAERLIKLVIVMATVIFVAGFLLKVLFPNFFLIKNLPVREFNLFFSFYTYAHNHLGDFLGLSLILIFAGLIKNIKRVYLASFFALVILFLYSFSRSAYLSLSLVISIFILQFRDRRVVIFFSTVLFFVIAFFFLISSPYGKLFHLPQKQFFNNRENYWQQGIQAIKEKPIFGFGMGNFGYASQKYRSNYYTSTQTAHNFLLENFVENGLLATLPLIIFLTLLLLSAWRRQSVFSLLFFYLFFIFQTDYIYGMYSVMVLFMILAAIVYEEKNEVDHTAVFGIITLFLYFALQMIVISHIFIKNNRLELAVQLYPLNKLAYPSLIQKKAKEGDSTGAIIIANQYKTIAPDDEDIVRTFAETYLTLGDKKKALLYFEKMYTNNHLLGLSIVEKIYLLKKEIATDQQAEAFIQQAFLDFNNAPYWYKTQALKEQIKTFCKKYKKDFCGKISW